MSETTNYKFPLYDSDDKPNLRDQYNGAINMIDNQLSVFAGNIDNNTKDISDLKETATQLQQDVAGKAPIGHASADATYGVGTPSLYGHLKVVDSGTQAASDGVAASPKFVNDEINKATATGKLLCIGDSYARMEDAGQISWCSYLQNNLGASVLTKYAEGGAGWITAGMSGHTFVQLVNSAVSEISDKDAYSYVVIAGGRNDGDNPDASQLRSAATTCLTALKTNFPNAKVLCVPMLWDNKRDYKAGVLNGAGAIISAAAACGVASANWAWTWGLGEDDAYDGGFHPQSKGGEIIAGYMLSCFMGSYSGRTLRVELTGFGNSASYCMCSGGTMAININGTYTQGQDIATLPTAIRSAGMALQGVCYAQGGSSTCIVQVAEGMGVYGGQSQGNIGGTIVSAW